MDKLALLLEYNGAAFHGWQIQSGVVTVQGCLEQALAKFADQPINTITAGRTDTGVHAINQVVHFCTDANRTLHGWVAGVNANLPATIRVKQSLIASPEFDARFSAISRTYHYYLFNRSVKPAILSSLVGWYPYSLHLANMQEAASFLIGKLDFSSFRAANCQANSPVRNMTSVDIDQIGDMIRFKFTANAFLYHMIRNIVGALVYVGAGKLTVDGFRHLIELKSRSKAPPTFMADGLYLAHIGYENMMFNMDDKGNNWLFTAADI